MSARSREASGYSSVAWAEYEAAREAARRAYRDATEPAYRALQAALAAAERVLKESAEAL